MADGDSFSASAIRCANNRGLRSANCNRLWMESRRSGPYPQDEAWIVFLIRRRLHRRADPTASLVSSPRRGPIGSRLADYRRLEHTHVRGPYGSRTFSTRASPARVERRRPHDRALRLAVDAREAPMATLAWRRGPLRFGRIVPDRWNARIAIHLRAPRCCNRRRGDGDCDVGLRLAQSSGPPGSRADFAAHQHLSVFQVTHSARSY